MADSQCKVCTVINRHDLAVPGHDSVDEALLVRWKGEAGHTEHGYRPLTTWFNKQLLRTVYDRQGRETLGNRVEADYEGLTGDDDLVSEELRRDLAADGIDVDRVLSDMVSWGTVRTHITDCLGKTKAQTASDSGWEHDAIATSRSVATDKVASALSALESKGELAGVEAATVEVDIQLSCEKCQTRVPLEVALEQGYICEQHAGAVRADR